jgi:hypothetical protein
MSLKNVLRERKEALLGRWLERVLAGYPERGRDFFGSEKDPFRNPVGTTLRSELAILLETVCGGDEQAGRDALARLIRLRAVQGFPGGGAIAFLIDLKGILREDVPEADIAELAVIFEQIDAMLLQAVDVLLACRERVWEIRAREARARVHSLLRQAGMLAEDGADEPAAPDEKGGGV